MASDADHGLLWALRLDGKGGARPMRWSDVCAWKPEDGVLWMHMDRGREPVRDWIEANLSERVGLHPGIDDALLAEETRPRCEHLNDALVLVLRGVNVNEGAEPADMVSVRLYADAHRVVSLRHDRVAAAQAVAKAFDQGQGPEDSGALLVHLIECIVDRIGLLVEELADTLDGIEERVLAAASQGARRALADLRRRVVQLRRHLGPQREALVRLAREPVPWVRSVHQADLRQLADRLTRYLEDLDEVRERAAVTQDEIASRTQEQLNRRILRLSIVAAVFLPLSLLAGMLGMNVRGIPLADSPYGFAVMCGAILALAIVEVAILRRMRWS